MRVITGTARGRKLITLEGGDIVRPTTDRVKEAMFSILQFEVQNASVLDLFAGSGQLGIEALSRGAASAVFVDANRKAVDAVKQNLKNTGLFEKAVVLHSDSLAFLVNTQEQFDIILLDPPYQSGLVEKALPGAANCCADNGIILCETDINEVLPETAGSFSVFKVYKYSKIKLTTYRKNI